MRGQFFRPIIAEDIMAYSDEQIIGHGLSAPVELLFKYRRSPLEQLLTVLIPVLFNGDYSPEKQQETLRDISAVYGAGIDDLLKLTRLIHSNYEVNMIDAITKLEMESEARGKAEGKAEALRIVARNFLENGVTDDIVMKSTGLSKDELDTLR